MPLSSGFTWCGSLPDSLVSAHAALHGSGYQRRDVRISSMELSPIASGPMSQALSVAALDGLVSPAWSAGGWVRSAESSSTVGLPNGRHQAPRRDSSAGGWARLARSSPLAPPPAPPPRFIGRVMATAVAILPPGLWLLGAWSGQG